MSDALLQHIDKLEAHVLELRQKLAIANVDTERLNWLDKNCQRDGSIRLGDGSFKACKAWAVSAHSGNLREVIDVIMKA